MPTKVAQAKHEELTWLLKNNNNNYSTLNAKLQKLLSKDLASVFSTFQQNDTTGIWSSAISGEYISFSEANEQQKDEAAAVLRELKATIFNYLNKDPELKTIKETLFRVPSDQNILIYPNGNNGKIAIVLTQWACNTLKNTHTNNPVGLITKRPAKETTEVNIVLKYSYGKIASNTKFTYQYKAIEQLKTTDANGNENLGLFKFGAVITIAEEGKPQYATQVTVKEGQELYEVLLPFATNALLSVINQKGDAVSNYTLHCIYDNFGKKTITTNDAGKAVVSDIILYDQSITFSDPKVPSNTQTYKLAVTDNNFVFEIKERIAKDVSLKVVDDKDKILENYPITILNSEINTTTNYFTDSKGTISLKDIAVNSLLTIKDGNNNEELKIHEVKDIVEKQEIKIVIHTPKKQKIILKLVDANEKPIPNIGIDFLQQDYSNSGITDSNGEIEDYKENFVNGKPIATKIYFNQKNKTKTIKRKINYKDEQDVYILKLKKKRFAWWWLLLLLFLPLLLLITQEKTIYVKTLFEDTQKAVPNTMVHFNYDSDYLFNSGTFFATNQIKDSVLSDANGIATFKNIKYSWYSLLFNQTSEAIIYAKSLCYSSNKETPRFHGISNAETLELQMNPVLSPIDFMTIDLDDKEPLPGTTLKISSEINGKTYSSIGKTDAAGRVVFDSLPICGNLNLVKAELDGYLPDSIAKQPIDKLLGHINKRTLKLKPIKQPIVFYVVDCNTKAPIPLAKAEIILTHKLKKSKQIKINTNVNGVGKGIYKDAPIISKLEVLVSKPYYKSNKLKGNYTVKQFNKLSKNKRTICLEPEENQIVFKNIDSITRNPLGAVRNIVKITYDNKTKIDTVMSRKNGTFEVSGIKYGSKTSILSSLRPDYKINDYTFKEIEAVTLLEPKSQKDLEIPLTPLVKPINFRTIDPLDDLVDDVTLKIMLDGSELLNPNNSGNGEFLVSAGFNSKLTIEATKTGYVTNTTKILDIPVKTLAKAQQKDRDIPMFFPPCVNGTQYKGGEKIKRFDLGKSNGRFKFEYFTDTQPDSIYIYTNKKGLRTSKDLIFKYEGATGTQAFGIIDYSKEIYSPERYITVKVVGSTNWGYKFECPK